MNAPTETSSMKLNVLQLLKVVPQEDLTRFRVEQDRGGRVVYADNAVPSSKDQSALVVRNKGWMLESHWRPPHRRRRITMKIRRLFQWRRRFRPKISKARAKKEREYDVSEDDIFDDDDSWQEEGIPDIHSDDGSSEVDPREKSYIHPPAVLCESENGCSGAETPWQTNTSIRSSVFVGEEEKSMNRFPRQFSVHFAENQDENSLRVLPRVRNMQGRRKKTLPRGVPLRPVNKHKEKEELAALAKEHTSSCSISEGSSSVHSLNNLPVHDGFYNKEKKVSPFVSKMNPLGPVFEDKTSPVSSIRSSGVSEDLSGLNDLKHGIQDLRLM